MLSKEKFIQYLNSIKNLDHEVDKWEDFLKIDIFESPLFQRSFDLIDIVIKYLSDNNIDIWIRQVLVPGITDDEKDLLKLKEFISTLKTVKKIEINPYHELGKFKWEELGLKYPLEGVRPADSNDVDRAKKILGIK